MAKKNRTRSSAKSSAKSSASVNKRAQLPEDQITLFINAFKNGNIEQAKKLFLQYEVSSVLLYNCAKKASKENRFEFLKTCCLFLKENKNEKQCKILAALLINYGGEEYKNFATQNGLKNLPSFKEVKDQEAAYDRFRSAFYDNTYNNKRLKKEESLKRAISVYEKYETSNLNWDFLVQNAIEEKRIDFLKDFCLYLHKNGDEETSKTIASLLAFHDQKYFEWAGEKGIKIDWGKANYDSRNRYSPKIGDTEPFENKNWYQAISRIEYDLNGDKLENLIGAACVKGNYDFLRELCDYFDQSGQFERARVLRTHMFIVSPDKFSDFKSNGSLNWSLIYKKRDMVEKEDLSELSKLIEENKLDEFIEKFETLNPASIYEGNEKRPYLPKYEYERYNSGISWAVLLPFFEENTSLFNDFCAYLKRTNQKQVFSRLYLKAVESRKTNCQGVLLNQGFVADPLKDVILQLKIDYAYLLKEIREYSYTYQKNAKKLKKELSDDLVSKLNLVLATGVDATEYQEVLSELDPKSFEEAEKDLLYECISIILNHDNCKSKGIDAIPEGYLNKMISQYPESKSVVSLLIENNPKLIVQKDEKGVDAISSALANKNIDLFYRLLERIEKHNSQYDEGSKERIDCSYSSDEMVGLLYTAAKNAGHEGVQALLTFDSADINEKDKKGDTPLLRAVKARDVETVKILLKNGADLSIKDGNGKTVQAILKEMGNNRKLSLIESQIKEVESSYTIENITPKNIKEFLTYATTDQFLEFVKKQIESETPSVTGDLVLNTLVEVKRKDLIYSLDEVIDGEENSKKNPFLSSINVSTVSYDPNGKKTVLEQAGSTLDGVLVIADHGDTAGTQGVISEDSMRYNALLQSINEGNETRFNELIRKIPAEQLLMYNMQGINPIVSVREHLKALSTLERLEGKNKDDFKKQLQDNGISSSLLDLDPASRKARIESLKRMGTQMIKKADVSLVNGVPQLYVLGMPMFREPVPRVVELNEAIKNVDANAISDLILKRGAFPETKHLYKVMKLLIEEHKNEAAKYLFDRSKQKNLLNELLNKESSPYYNPKLDPLSTVASLNHNKDMYYHLKWLDDSLSSHFLKSYDQELLDLGDSIQRVSISADDKKMIISLIKEKGAFIRKKDAERKILYNPIDGILEYLTNKDGNVEEKRIALGLLFKRAKEEGAEEYKYYIARFNEIKSDKWKKITEIDSTVLGGLDEKYWKPDSERIIEAIEGPQKEAFVEKLSSLIIDEGILPPEGYRYKAIELLVNHGKKEEFEILLRLAKERGCLMEFLYEQPKNSSKTGLELILRTSDKVGIKPIFFDVVKDFSHVCVMRDKPYEEMMSNAIKQKNIETLRSLITTEEVCPEPYQCFDVLSVLVECQDKELIEKVFELLLPKGVNPTDVLNTSNERGTTLLMLAAKSGNLEMIDFFIKKGADTKSRDIEGRSFLDYATSTIRQQLINRDDVQDLVSEEKGASAYLGTVGQHVQPDNTREREISYSSKKRDADRLG